MAPVSARDLRPVKAQCRLSVEASGRGTRESLVLACIVTTHSVMSGSSTASSIMFVGETLSDYA